jgi:hypothetical protein
MFGEVAYTFNHQDSRLLQIVGVVAITIVPKFQYMILDSNL